MLEAHASLRRCCKRPMNPSHCCGTFSRFASNMQANEQLANSRSDLLEMLTGGDGREDGE